MIFDIPGPNPYMTGRSTKTLDDFKYVVLDLDQTLFHAVSIPKQTMSLTDKFISMLKFSASDERVDSVNGVISFPEHGFKLVPRPGLTMFMSRLCKSHRVGVFSGASEKYVNLVLGSY